jgi:hypothetical protein
VSVYVDNARIPAHVGHIWGRWSHLTADTPAELVAFAGRIGLRPEWLQTCTRSPCCQPAERCVHWHFDVTDTKRAEAIAAGAVAIDLRQMADLIARRVAARVGEVG